MPLLYYRKSDNIICMALMKFLFKTDQHLSLARLLWSEKLTASVHEFAQMSGLPYATAHGLLQKMLKMGLVKKTKSGRATLFSSSLPAGELRHLLAMMEKSVPTNSGRKPLADFPEMELHLVGEFPELRREKAQSHEELLVKVVSLSKKNPTLLRALPLLVKKLGPHLKASRLSYWSKRFHVDRELGFVLELTSHLSQEAKYARLAKSLKDKRWSKQGFFLDKEASLTGFQAKLVETNTPELAKKWFLKMNMGLDSFESMYAKFA